jgi:hypothetical protein
MMSLQSADYSKFDPERTMLRTSASAPDLSAARRKPSAMTPDAKSPARRSSVLRASTPQSQQSMTTGQVMRMAGIDTCVERQPDYLLKALKTALDLPKHPLHRNLDCFPVLARLVKGKTFISSSLVTHADVIKLGNIADSFKDNIANRVRPKKETNQRFR